MTLIRLLISIFLALFLSFSVLTYLRAEDNEHSATGKVVSVVSDHLVISMRDQPKFDQKREQIFMVSPKTVYKNILSINDLNRNDQVEITYMESRGEKIAVSISRANKEEDRIPSSASQ